MGWCGLQEFSSPPPCPREAQLWSQTQLLRALCSQGLKSPKDRDGTAISMQPVPVLGYPATEIPHLHFL